MGNTRTSRSAWGEVMDLTLPLKGIYFDQIARGEKLFEYRLHTPYWDRRIVGRQYDNLVLTRGYPKGGGVEGLTRLTMPYRGYVPQRLKHEHFGPDEVPVLAIHAEYNPHNPRSE